MRNEVYPDAKQTAPSFASLSAPVEEPAKELAKSYFDDRRVSEPGHKSYNFRKRLFDCVNKSKNYNRFLRSPTLRV